MVNNFDSHVPSLCKTDRIRLHVSRDVSYPGLVLVGGGAVVVVEGVEVVVVLGADVEGEVAGLGSASGDEHGTLVVVDEADWLGSETVAAHPKFEKRVSRVSVLPSAKRVVEVMSRMKPAASTPTVALVPV
jgi:hypothetical protein